MPQGTSTLRRAIQVSGVVCALLIGPVGCSRGPGAYSPDAGNGAEVAHLSELWGQGGEAWDPAGRLPDFSFAGYRAGELPIPDVPTRVNVMDFGARGDGTSDDSDAFLAAIEAASDGAVFIPNGRYRITKVLEIRKSGVVLRGESRDGTVLYFPKTLHEVLGKGRNGGPYGWSWGGGWIWVNPDRRIGDAGRRTWRQGEFLAEVVAPAARGDSSVRVSETSRLRPGQLIRLVQRETDGSLSLSLHGQHKLAGKCQINRRGRKIVNWVVVVEGMEGDRLGLGRPLRVPVSPDWSAQIWSAEPEIEEVGIESLTVEFPVRQYEGHHNEPGLNAISLAETYNSWVRDVAIINADNGIFFWGSRHATAQDIVIAGRGGHYGVGFGACQDCLLTRFRIDSVFVHDLSVANLGNGNVFSRGQGIAVNFDHHRYAPYDNLFSAIEVGTAHRNKRLWECSATASGHYAAARETFWNIKPRVRTAYLPLWPAMNVIGTIDFTGGPREKELIDPWLEAIDELWPTDLHLAQLERRLGRAVHFSTKLPPPVPNLSIYEPEPFARLPRPSPAMAKKRQVEEVAPSDAGTHG